MRFRFPMFASIMLLGLTAQAAPTSPPAGGAGAGADAEKLRRGVVQVEQGGRPMAVGTVLANDGRVLTSLSALGSVENPEIRFADNTIVKAKVGHKDKA